ncbi:MAG: heavy metal translocating P-type ATPase [Bacteroidia bacterium]
MPKNLHIAEKLVCYHCGEDCETDKIVLAEKHFCCEGCKTVYEIINQSNLCEYYDINKNPGLTRKIKVREGKFAFLDDASVQAKLVHFTDGRQNHVNFYLPQMHCSSCIWLLEQLPKLNSGVLKSQVNFLKKEISIVFDPKITSLRKVAELITSLGYEPHISLHDISQKEIKKYDRSRIYRIGIAGFCFGNIMMLSFPDYFSSGNLNDPSLKHLFNYLNLLLSLPVFFYCAGEFFISSWKSLKQNFLNIDAPIALAIVITFARSIYEILSDTGVGYLDSMSGIVFFMLLGRFFQDKTYQNLSFERDYTSYFPLGVTLLNEDGTEKQIPVSQLKTGQRIKIHSHEIIPADAILFLGKATIDYSFVTGESLPVEKSIGEIIYAGGKQTGGALELEVVKDVSQSYLTQLWNNDTFKKENTEKKVSFIHAISRYFTYVLFSIAIVTGLYWYFHDTSKILSSVTAILIVACPCALLLSATFTNGNMLRMLQKFGFYAKNAGVLERISDVDVVVFDKTGTLTQQEEAQILYEGKELSEEEKQLIRSLANQSSHPLSKAVSSSLPFSKNLPVRNFKEIKGNGIKGSVNGNEIKLGSAEFIYGEQKATEAGGSFIFISINEEVKGFFTVKNKYRAHLQEVISDLKRAYSLAVISGDNEAERETCRKYFGTEATLLFNQKPQDKLDFIKKLQSEGKKVMMIGDGLNDAGALQQSDAGVVVADDINNFSPACDVILDGKNFGKLNRLINYCKKEKSIIMGSFVISVLYNLVGLFFAVQGTLEPVIAAILMPVSSISIVLFTTGMSSFFAHKLKN